MLSRVNFATPKGRTVAGAPNPTLAAVLAGQGRNGDTMVAHIDPREAALLKRHGGSGTINPIDGLPEFWEDGGGAGNSAGANSGNQGNSNGGGGNAGGNGGSAQANAAAVGRGSGYTGNNNEGDPAMGGPGARGPLGPTGAPVHTAGTSSPMGPAPTGDYAGVGSTYEGAASSFANRSTADKVTGALLGMIPGMNYAVKPTPNDPATYAGGTWHSGFNPGGAIGSIAGMASGIPGLSAVGSMIGDAISPNISFGSHAVTPGEAAIGMNGGLFGGGTVPGAGQMANGSPGSPNANSPGGPAMGNGNGTGGQNGNQVASVGAPALAAALAPNTAGGGLNPASNPTVGMPMAPWMHGMRRRPPLVSMHGVGGH